MGKFFENMIDYISNNPELCISLLAFAVALFSLIQQRKHDRLSLRPLAVIRFTDFDDFLLIKLKNAGIGPMIVTRLETKHVESGVIMGYPIEWFENKSYIWNNFRKPSGDYVLSVDEEVSLLDYSIQPYEGQTKEHRKHDIVLIREILKDLSIKVEYKDIYNKRQKAEVKKLNWFGRQNRI